MADGAAADAEFLVEDVEAIIKGALQSTLADVAYDHDKVGAWTTAVIDSSLKGLQALGKPFKYVVTCIIMQKTGAGLHTAAGAFWDRARDGICKVPWENATMHCVVTVFGLCVSPGAAAEPAY